MYRLRNIAMRDYQESVTTGHTDQGCNFVNFSRGHVGPRNKNFRSPHENLRAHNDHDEKRFILVKIPKQFNC